MQPLEIEERNDDVPLDPTMSRELPLGPLTKGMKPSVLKRRAQILIVGLPIIFFALSCAFSGYQIYWTNMFNKEHPYTEISQILYRLQDLNCNFKMITNIRPIKKGEDCVNDFKNNEDVGVWNGTVSGCEYKDSGMINLQPCPMSNENYIRETAPETLYVWKGNRFCTKTVGNYAFNVQGKEYYGDRAKKCHAEPMPIYVSPSEDCPISDLKIVSSTAFREPSYTYVPLDDGRLLAYKNDPDSPRRLVDLNTELNDAPCYNPSLSPLKYKTDVGYPLSKKKEKDDCGEYGKDEESIQKLDKYSALAFYTENILTRRQENLPLWEYYHRNKDVILFGKFRDGMKSYTQCNFCNRTFALDKSAQELTISGKYMSTYVVVTTVMLIFQFFLIAFNLVKYIEYENNYLGLFNDVVYINALFYFANLCYFAAHGLIAYSDYSQLWTATESVRLIEELDCFKSPQLNRLFDDLRGKILANSKDIMEDCFKAEFIAIFCAALFILANYVNKQLLNRDQDLAAANRYRHEQSGVIRAEYAPHNVSKALPEPDTMSDDSKTTDREEPKKKESSPVPKEEKKEAEKKNETTTILDD